MLRDQVIGFSMETARARSTSWCTVPTWRRAIPCHDQKQWKLLSYVQFFEMASREELSYFDEELFQLVGSVGDANIFCGLQHVEPVYRIKHEFDRFSKYFVKVKIGIVYGGVSIAKERAMLKESYPHVLIGTPGRVCGTRI